MTRWKAFAAHLVMSFVVVGGIALAAFLLWYPHGLYHLAGLDRLLLIMLALDVTAGPLLTLVIFKAGKRGLKFDLAFIAVCQLAFLSYGLHALWESRPVFLVANDVRFNLVLANDLDARELARASRPEWRRLSWFGPRLVGSAPPQDPAERQTLMNLFLTTGVDLDKLPRYYVPFDQVRAELVRNSQPGVDGRRHVPVVSRYAVAQMQLDAQGNPDGVATR